MKTDQLQSDFIELETSKYRRKYFLHVYLYSEEIWVDTKLLPEYAFLCAACDGVSLRLAFCGKSGKLKRLFVNIDWVINNWGGDKDIVNAFKKKKEEILKQIPELKEKYGFS